MTLFFFYLKTLSDTYEHLLAVQGRTEYTNLCHRDRMRLAWITQTSEISHSNSIESILLKPIPGSGPDRGQIHHNQTQMPEADKAFFSRCFRKSMWWKGSFPPKHRQLPCCSFYLGWSINLHPDLVYATALLRGGLMCSTSPLMEALPRLSQISKTDTLGVPSGQGILLFWPFDAKECLFPWQSFAPQSM